MKKLSYKGYVLHGVTADYFIDAHNQVLDICINNQIVLYKTKEEAIEAAKKLETIYTKYVPYEIDMKLRKVEDTKWMYL